MNTSRIISLVTVATLFSSMSFAIAKEKKVAAVATPAWPNTTRATNFLDKGNTKLR